MHTHRIISINDELKNNIRATIHILGSNKTFERPISELYESPLLAQFPREDATHIAALYAAEKSQNLALLKQIPQPSPVLKDSVIVVGILFTAFLILSNLAAFKIATLGHFAFPAGLLFFPVTYIFDDILTEVYGFKISRRIIWSALLANFVVIAGTWLTTYLPATVDWHNQSAYELIYRSTPRIFIASTIAYFFGEFTNSIILAKLKIFFAGRYFWLRVLVSTAIGVGLDNILFIHIAFLFVVPYSILWNIFLTVYVVKVTYEMCAMPITYKIVNYLKKRDSVDHYDFKTKFNPFSLAL